MMLWFHRWWEKIGSWQNWPTFVFYAVPFLYYLFLSLKARSFFFFHAVNPGMYNAGLVGDSKWKVLRQLPKCSYPRTIIFKPGDELHEIQDIKFPVVLKPDDGQRGKGVTLVDNRWQLEFLLRDCQETMLIQDYASLEEEWGLFFIRFPGQHIGKISSLMQRKFWTVSGDGNKNLWQLAQSSPEWVLQSKRMKPWKGQWEKRIPNEGEQVLIEPIGNHNRGTTFIDQRDLISKTIANRISHLLEGVEGFHFGRLDIKIQSLEDFTAGGPISILEINGMKAEPAHMYQPGYSLMKAWCDVMWHWKVAYMIAMENKMEGYQFPSFTSGISMIFEKEDQFFS
jgi:hypothetical protein